MLEDPFANLSVVVLNGPRPQETTNAGQVVVVAVALWPFGISVHYWAPAGRRALVELSWAATDDAGGEYRALMNGGVTNDDGFFGTTQLVPAVPSGVDYLRLMPVGRGREVGLESRWQVPSR